MPGWSRWVGCAAAGCGVALAFPPRAWPAAAWVAPLVLVAALRGRSGREAAGLGCVFVLAAGLALSDWLPAVLVTRFGASPGAAQALRVGACASFLPAAAVGTWAMSRIACDSCGYAPALGLLWAGVELAWERVLPGLPWFSLAASWIDTPLAPAGAVIGAHGVSGLVAALAAAAAQLLPPAAPRAALSGGLVVAAGAALAVGLAPAPTPHAAGARLRVALVQPAVPLPPRLEADFERRNLAALVALSRRVRAVDLLVWPESALPSGLDGRPERARALARLSAEVGAPILLGAGRGPPAARANSVLLVRASGPVEPVYDKRRPLAVAEYAPLWLPRAGRRALGSLVPPRPRRAGRGALRAPAELAGAEILLCYEAIFSRAPRRADAPWLLNPVNDGWIDTTAAARHHLLLARWRALETGAPLVRVAATGISALVAPDGSLRSALEARVPGVLRVELGLAARVTPFERLGGETLAAPAAVLLGLLARRLRRVKTRSLARGAA